MIINYLLDRRWHSLAKIEDRVCREKMVLHLADPAKSGKVPSIKDWRSHIRVSLRWMATAHWVEIKRVSEDRQDFRITKDKRRYYLNWKKAYEKDKALGRVRPDGVYKKSGQLRPLPPALATLLAFKKKQEAERGGD